jgi:hypothetical protein
MWVTIWLTTAQQALLQLLVGDRCASGAERAPLRQKAAGATRVMSVDAYHALYLTYWRV